MIAITIMKTRTTPGMKRSGVPWPAKLRKEMKHVEKKPCFGVIRLVCLVFLLACPNSNGADGKSAGPAITWLPLTQASPPSKIAGLRRDILTFLESLRRKLFGAPNVVLTTAYFISVSPAAMSSNAFPSATSTNADGTLACVLSAAQFSSYHQRIQRSEAVNQFAAPRVGALEGVRATLSVSRTVQIGGTNAAYGETVDLVHHVNGPNLDMRVVADVTQAVTNVSRATAEGPATESVSIRTLFQSALEARVPSGGGVAVWTKPAGGSEKIYLLLISPVIQTNALSPLPAPPPGAKQPSSTAQ